MSTPLSHPYLGPAAASRALEERLAQVAASDVTVWIHGESGSGKNLAALALHARSRRADGPFVALSLAALPASLLEAELFGHEEGAFTGAQRSRIGRFRQADGGTLLLDDVDALPLELQAKLLRVLQERRVEPVGAERAEPIDVRLVSTSTLDLRQLVEGGRFRADLFWRLAVVELAVPPLRVRQEDLPQLAAQLIQRLSAEHRLVPRELAPGSIERLRAHPWPGNVRELENALERVLVFAPPDSSGAGPAAVQPDEFDFLEPAAQDAAGDIAARALAHGLTLDVLERALIERALEEQRGNLSAAARQIGLSRRALDYRLARLRGGHDGQEASA